MPRHRLRDAIWASLHAKLRAMSGIWKKDSERLRQFVEAVVYVLRTGVAWEDLPERFGKPNSLYRRFRRWSLQGIWDALFTAGVPEDALETVMVDATITKAQRFASGARGGGEEDLGRSRRSGGRDRGLVRHVRCSLVGWWSLGVGQVALRQGGTSSSAPFSFTQTASRLAASVGLGFWVRLCSVPGGSTQLCPAR